MPQPFRITTPRLQLRGWKVTDRPAFERLVNDSEMMRFISDGAPWNEAKISEFSTRQAHNLERHGYCIGALILQETNEVIGVAGLQPQLLAGEDELAWWVGRDWQRRGYASEIGLACLRYGIDVLRRRRIVALAHPANKASLRVMRNIGMHYLDTVNARSLEARYPDTPVARYAFVVPAE